MEIIRSDLIFGTGSLLVTLIPLGTKRRNDTREAEI
jgi:hypothetical protein